MKSKKEKAYDKLFKYVDAKYSDENIEWGTDLETESTYSMRAVLTDMTQRVISIDMESKKITDKEQIWSR